MISARHEKQGDLNFLSFETCYSSGWPGIHYASQAGLELPEMPASASQVLIL